MFFVRLSACASITCLLLPRLGGGLGPLPASPPGSSSAAAAELASANAEMVAIADFVGRSGPEKPINATTPEPPAEYGETIAVRGGYTGMWIEKCRGMSEYPLYLINTDDKPERLAYSRFVWGEDFTRVRGMNASIYEEISESFDLPSKTRFDFDVKTYTLSQLGVQAGEAACLGAHLHALEQIEAAGHEIAMVFEDDIGPQLCPMWPASLTAVVEQASRLDPGWTMIRLSWHVLGSRVYEIMDRHLTWLSSTADPTLAARYGEWQADDVPLLARCEHPLWGTGATIWHRRGVERVLAGARKPGHKHFDCGPGHSKPHCHVDDVLLNPARQGCYNSIPAFLGVRLMEEGSNIRGPNQFQKVRHRMTHFRQTLWSAHWFMNLMEVFTPLGRLLPDKNLEVEVRMHDRMHDKTPNA